MKKNLEHEMETRIMNVIVPCGLGNTHLGSEKRSSRKKRKVRSTRRTSTTAQQGQPWVTVLGNILISQAYWGLVGNKWNEGI